MQYGDPMFDFPHPQHMPQYNGPMAMSYDDPYAYHAPIPTPATTGPIFANYP